MENQNLQLTDLEQALTHRNAELLQDIEKTRLDDCVEEIRYLTETLESVVSMESAELIGTGTAADITKAVGMIRESITDFLREHKDALSVVLPAETIMELNPLISRFSRSVDQFEILAEKLITALIAYEGLNSTRLVN